jgi:transposase
VRTRSRFQVVEIPVASSFMNYFLMSKYTEIYGVDISKDVYDVYGSLVGHNRFKNDEQGFDYF